MAVQFHYKQASINIKNFFLNNTADNFDLLKVWSLAIVSVASNALIVISIYVINNVDIDNYFGLLINKLFFWGPLQDIWLPYERTKSTVCSTPESENELDCLMLSHGQTETQR